MFLTLKRISTRTLKIIPFYYILHFIYISPTPVTIFIATMLIIANSCCFFFFISNEIIISHSFHFLAWDLKTCNRFKLSCACRLSFYCHWFSFLNGYPFCLHECLIKQIQFSRIFNKQT